MVTNFAFDFRNTAGFVTDPALSAPVLQESYPHTYTNGNGDSVVAGNISGVADIASRDRNAANDPRLAGINFNNAGNFSGTNPSFYKLRVDLPSAGTWSIHFAFGDPSNPQNQFVTLFDSATVITTYVNVSTVANSFMDATGNVYTQASFFASQAPLQHAFQSTNFTIQLGPTPPAGSNFTTISYLQITFVPPASSKTIKILRYGHGSRMQPPYNPGGHQ